MHLALLSMLVACHPTSDEGEDSAAERSGADDTAAAIEPPRGALQLALPLAEPERFTQRVGVDHDPAVYEGIEQLRCSDYLGRAYPWCYDEHDGTDLILEGDFDAMDADSPGVFAAAPGVIVRAEDGHYDRCHGNLETGSSDCDGNDGIANAVTLEHETGHRTLYWHLKNGSVAVEVGDEIEAGALLGHVGSSGNSVTPHLHFELQDADGTVIDPFAGPYSQEETWWCDQGTDEALPGACD